MLKRIVVKFGTKELMNGSRKLNERVFSRAAAQIASLTREGVEVIVVSSGAIQAGRELLLRGDLEKKELAAVGGMRLFGLWCEAFQMYKRKIAPVLLTYSNWENDRERENVRCGILKLLRNRIIPIINENDFVADDEIVSMEKGISENDRLARMIAELIEAEGVLFLTDAGGIYDRDPQDFPEASKIREVKVKDFICPNGGNPHGKGGVEKKYEAAAYCTRIRSVKRVAIGGSKKGDVILRFAEEKEIDGTEIL